MKREFSIEEILPLIDKQVVPIINAEEWSVVSKEWKRARTYSSVYELVFASDGKFWMIEYDHPNTALSDDAKKDYPFPYVKDGIIHACQVNREIITVEFWSKKFT